MNKLLIVGLGNPGKQYEKTKHNIGFIVVDRIASEFRLQYKGGFEADYTVSNIEGKRVYIAKPQTYMNLSGKAVSEIKNYFDIENNSIIVVHDDLDIEFGKIKIKVGGSSGGHNGINSIISCLGSDSFIRVKMGIGKPLDKNISHYVLSEFSLEEKSLLPQFIDLGFLAIMEIIKSDVKTAMNRFNNKTITKEVKEKCQV